MKIFEEGLNRVLLYQSTNVAMKFAFMSLLFPLTLPNSPDRLGEKVRLIE